VAVWSGVRGVGAAAVSLGVHKAPFFPVVIGCDKGISGRRNALALVRAATDFVRYLPEAGTDQARQKNLAVLSIYISITEKEKQGGRRMREPTKNEV
jgi:hypothetical protein